MHCIKHHQSCGEWCAKLMWNSHMLILQVRVLIFVRQYFFLKFKRVHMMCQVIKVDRCGAFFLKLDTLDSNLQVFGLLIFWERVILVRFSQTIYATLLLWLVLLHHNYLIQAKALLVKVGRVREHGVKYWSLFLVFNLYPHRFKYLLRQPVGLWCCEKVLYYLLDGVVNEHDSFTILNVVPLHQD